MQKEYTAPTDNARTQPEGDTDKAPPLCIEDSFWSDIKVTAVQDEFGNDGPQGVIRVWNEIWKRRTNSIPAALLKALHIPLRVQPDVFARMLERFVEVELLSFADGQYFHTPLTRRKNQWLQKKARRAEAAARRWQNSKPETPKAEQSASERAVCMSNAYAMHEQTECKAHATPVSVSVPVPVSVNGSVDFFGKSENLSLPAQPDPHIPGNQPEIFLPYETLRLSAMDKTTLLVNVVHGREEYLNQQLELIDAYLRSHEKTLRASGKWPDSHRGYCETWLIRERNNPKQRPDVQLVKTTSPPGTKPTTLELNQELLKGVMERDRQRKQRMERSRQAG